MFEAAMEFLDDLAGNNDKTWFEANRERYDKAVKAPTIAFVEAMAPRIKALSPQLVAIATGRGSSISRIHRDTRFSADRSPYKSYIGIHFTNQAGKEAPGLHLHLSRADSGVGLGVWTLPPPALKQIRDRIAAKDGGWGEVREALDTGGFSFIGDALKRVPKDYPADHPYGDDLRRKTFGAGRPVDPTKPLVALCDEVEAAYVAGWPLMGFLCGALGVPI